MTTEEYLVVRKLKNDDIINIQMGGVLDVYDSYENTR